MKLRYLFPLLLGSYLIALLINLPASRLLSWVDIQPLSLEGVSGSLLDGHANRLQINPEQQIDNLNWQITLSSLLKARLGSQLEFNYLGGKGNAHAAVSANQTLYLNEARFEIAAKKLEVLLPLPLATFTGEITALIDSAMIKQSGAEEITGRLFWNKASLTTPMPATVKLGQVSADISTDDNGLILVKLNNKGGDLALDGKLTLSAQGQYDLDLKITPAGNTAAAIRNGLSQMAQRQSDGSYRIKDKGQLSELI